MKKHLVLISCIAATIHSTSAQTVSQPKAAQPAVRSTDPSLPANGTGVLYVDVAPWATPRSMKELVNLSPLIIEGVVEKVMPSRESSPRIVETDSLITITRIIKGPAVGSAVVVSQAGGTIGNATVKPAQYSLLQKGDRYVLFLQADERSVSPPTPGFKRYTVTGASSGLFFFGTDDLMHVNADEPDRLRKNYEGASRTSIVDLVKMTVAAQ